MIQRVERPPENAEGQGNVMPEDIVGIDLGTTNSLIGVMEAGFPILLADADGSRLTPSVVHFPGTGEPVVGVSGDRMRAVQPALAASQSASDTPSFWIASFTFCVSLTKSEITAPSSA